MKLRTGNFFEDFRIGQRMRHATPRTISEGDCALYIALTGERHPLHCTRPFAQALGYPDRPVDDLLLFHIAFGKTVPDVSLNAIANLGYADVRFLEPAYAGDTIRAESEVIGLRQTSDGKAGVVYVRSAAFNQHGRELLAWVRWVMVGKRDPAASAPPPVVPPLPAAVPPERLPVPPFLHLRAFPYDATGVRDFWEAHEPGEQIVHLSGMTVTEADHTLATRLYQNPARVHFDAVAMKDSRFGQRIVYGGHAISVCRALSYDGLENALAIAAINGGRHVNPVVAGDTLYASTQVLERWALPGRDDIGALRLRLLGTRNVPATEIAAPQDAGDAYDARVVLDLDYTVYMPRLAALPA